VSAGDVVAAWVDAGARGVDAGAGGVILMPDDLGLDGGSDADGGRVPREGMLSREGLLGGVFAPPLLEPPLLGPPETGFLTLLKLRPERLGLFCLSVIDFLLYLRK